MKTAAPASKLQQFLRKERARLVGYVRSLIADAADRDGEDIVQDVLMSVFSRPEPVLAIENLPGYVYQSLRNRVTDTFRRLREGQVSLDSVPEGRALAPLCSAAFRNVRPGCHPGHRTNLKEVTG